MVHQQQLTVTTKARSTHNITREVEAAIQQSGIRSGLCHVFIHHTSASLIITENADPAVRKDLEYFMAKTALDGDPNYIHDQEGPDDMSAHIRSVLTQTEVTIPVVRGASALGTWQGVFVWEHRSSPHQRLVTLTVTGE